MLPHFVAVPLFWTTHPPSAGEGGSGPKNSQSRGRGVATLQHLSDPNAKASFAKEKWGGMITVSIDMDRFGKNLLVPSESRSNKNRTNNLTA